MLNRSILSNCFLLLVLSLLFVACEKESLEPTTDTFTTENLTINETTTSNLISLSDEDIVNSVSTPCYEVLFPATLAFPNGETLEVNSEDELHQAIRRWVVAHPNTDRRPHIAFPYRVVLQNGDTVAVRNANTIRRIINACETDRPTDRPCYKLVFPVTIQFPGGDTLEVATKEEFAEAIRRWVAAHPDATRRPHITFPYDVMLRNGDTVTIENFNQLKRLIKNCRPDGPGGNDDPCYRVIFPATLVFPNGQTLEVNSKAEMLRAIARWKKAHPNATRRPRLAFPYDVELENGTVATIDSEAALKRLLNYCANERPDRPTTDRCFRVNYPATLAFPDGQTLEVDSYREMLSAIARWKRANPTATERPALAFPYDVTLADGTTVTIDNATTLERVKNSCD